MKPQPWPGALQPLARQCRRNWEALFLVAIECLLGFQVLVFQVHAHELNHIGPLVAGFATFNAFVFSIYGPLLLTILPTLLITTVIKGAETIYSRRIYDFFASYFIVRMLVQLIGLNILVFDETSSRFLLISQLIYFLPTLLLIWGWIYWRLDRLAQAHGSALFRVEHDRDRPRVIDYFVASFSSVFSASINGVKGTSARSRILVLLHGFMIYDVMGLTLSRAVALVQR